VAPVIASLREAGLLVNAAGERTVRFAPPFIVTRQELDEGLSLVERVLTAL
jgi:acetylornithine/N-succinyldiaminopimelate aminotransferase